MKTLNFLLVIGLTFVASSCSNSSAKNTSTDKKLITKNTDEGFAVVELFTSEGCSSCPPADKAVAKLLDAHKNIYVLSYHVDYWNNLGWKDVFSSAAYSNIQRNYARHFKLASVYTPQVIVNGTEQFVGSDVNKLNASVNKSLQQNLNIDLKLNAVIKDDNEITVHYSTNATEANVQIALIELSADHAIKSGENSGATLHHVNIVKDVKTAAASKDGIVVLKIPADLELNNCKVIAFVQDVNDNRIIAAKEEKAHT